MDKLAELSEALLQLDGEGAARLIGESLEAGIPAARILSEGLSSGMRKVGEQFREGVIYMPEVLVACDIYYSGLEKLRPLIQPGENRQARGRMILGTIHGDIHTVGKDVAVPVFEAAGYDVIDLGVDVADEKIVEAIREHRPDLVGLGTYMTSTFMHTRETVKAIEAAGLRGQVKIICGGPSVDAGAAKRMGADDASDDAWEAVGKLDRLMDELKAQGRTV
ncbi:MAG: cobalamin-dependent protein [Bryobacterales bacterium]|nr:cobalamin-dependent protein [Bryobacterales bacterium]